MEMEQIKEFIDKNTPFDFTQYDQEDVYLSEVVYENDEYFISCDITITECFEDGSFDHEFGTEKLLSVSFNSEISNIRVTDQFDNILVVSQEALQFIQNHLESLIEE